MRWLALLLALPSACRVPSRPQPERINVQWRLVELVTTDPAGDALVAPHPTLFLEPVPPQVTTRILREQTGVGQPAEMEIRVAEGGGRVGIRLKPSRPGVRILGPDLVVVGEGHPVTVRFTSDSPGRASLAPEVAWDADLSGAPER